jgi:hypothetical protein
MFASQRTCENTTAVCFAGSSPSLVEPREEGRAVVAVLEVALQLGVALRGPLQPRHQRPRLVRERPRVEAFRRRGVALEDERVVLEAAHELDHVQATLERQVGERPFGRVVPLVE